MPAGDCPQCLEGSPANVHLGVLQHGDQRTDCPWVFQLAQRQGCAYAGIFIRVAQKFHQGVDRAQVAEFSQRRRRFAAHVSIFQ